MSDVVFSPRMFKIQELEGKDKIPIGSMKKLAAEFQAKIRADTNAARGLSNASRGFGLDVDMFTSDIGPPTERTREDLLNRKMCILLGDEESHQPLVSFHANVFLKNHQSISQSTSM